MSRSRRKTPVFMDYGTSRRLSMRDEKKYETKRRRVLERSIIQNEDYDSLSTKKHVHTKWDWDKYAYYHSPYNNDWCRCRDWNCPERQWDHETRQYLGKTKWRTAHYECYIHKEYGGDYEKFMKEMMRK